MSETPKVSVPYIAPDILNYIPGEKQYKAGDTIEISGRARDAQDGWLRDGFEWYVDGNLQSSEQLFSNNTLAPGKHTITIKATNSAGLTSSRDYVIEIVG